MNQAAITYEKQGIGREGEFAAKSPGQYQRIIQAPDSADQNLLDDLDC